jgi:LmbE family N-acetylglucosaminyl deacetylase
MNILAVFAHPDDETYGPAATLARYALSGHRVSLVTMTRGEAGSLGICKDMDPKDVAVMRSAEWKCAAKALHIQQQKLYDLPDKGLTDYPLEKGAEIVRQEIRTHQPDILITFHDKGISGHPDHIAASRWCYQAVQSLAEPPRLIYFGITNGFASQIKENRKVYPMNEGEITHVIDISEYFSYKLKAIQCHASQLELWEMFKKWDADKRYFSRQEHFSQVLPALNGNKVFDDLFLC